MNTYAKTGGGGGLRHSGVPNLQPDLSSDLQNQRTFADCGRSFSTDFSQGHLAQTLVVRNEISADEPKLFHKRPRASLALTFRNRHGLPRVHRGQLVYLAARPINLDRSEEHTSEIQ